MAKAKSVKPNPAAKPVTADEKSKALGLALAQIEKDYGEGAVMYLNERSRIKVESTPTGSLNLDLALGVGGLPKGRIVEIYGQESGGKTTVSLHVVAEAQKLGGVAAFVDVEHALDPLYAKKLGVNVDELLVSQPDTGEQALEIVERLVRSGAIDVIVLDSVAAMATRAEIDGEMGDPHVGQQARLMSMAMRKLTAIIGKTGTVAIFINQVREKIGGYGNPETTPGGRALKFYSSVRIQVSKTSDKIMDGTDQIGVRTRCKVTKNKVAPPFKICEFDMLYGIGISKIGEILDLGVELELLKKSGAWYYRGDMRLGQGRENAKKFLSDNPDIATEIESEIRERFREMRETNSADDDSENAAAGTAKTPKFEIDVSDMESDDEAAEFSPDEL